MCWCSSGSAGHVQGFPDNYTPTESFLAAIEKNKDLRLYSLQECLQGAAKVGKEVGRVVGLALWLKTVFDKLRCLVVQTSHSSKLFV